MAKVTVTIEFHVDVEDLGAAYSNEEFLIEEVKEQIAHGLYRFDAQDVTFNRIDIEGM
jgi:anti-sigma28 factor (negative regulator of flagellin synthesis)